MPDRGPFKGSSYLFVALSERGCIDSAHVFFTLPSDVKHAAESRALIQGTRKFKVYRVKPSKGDDLEFELVK